MFASDFVLQSRSGEGGRGKRIKLNIWFYCPGLLAIMWQVWLYNFDIKKKKKIVSNVMLFLNMKLILLKFGRLCSIQYKQIKQCFEYQRYTSMQYLVNISCLKHLVICKTHSLAKLMMIPVSLFWLLQTCSYLCIVELNSG